MSRFLTDDFINKDPRALLNTSKLATLADMVTPTSQYLKATDRKEITLESDCVFCISGMGVFKTNTTTLGVANLDTGSNFTNGKDYYVYICDTGNNNDEIYKISLNSTFPTGQTAFNSRKIGGFHYGKCRGVNTENLRPINVSGVEFGTGWESNVFDGIVPHSVWTHKHRPKSSPEGMVYMGGGIWVDIYLSSDDGEGGLKSTYNSLPMTGTEGMSQYSFNERALAAGKRLLTYDEFCRMAYGSPQGLNGDNANAWTAGTGRKETGFVVNAVSSIGTRDAVGNVWEWLSTYITRAEHYVFPTTGTFSDGGRAGKSFTTGNGHGTSAVPAWNWDTVSPFGDGYGNIFQYYDYSLVALLGGGAWNSGAMAGSRCVSLYNFPWNVHASLGCRLACDCL